MADRSPHDPDDLRASPSLVQQVLTSADAVGDVLARAAVKTHRRPAKRLAADTTWHRRHDVAADIVAEHVELARTQGRTTAAAITAIQVTSVWGSAGTLTLPATALGLAADLSSLAVIQARMVVRIAAVAGADLDDTEAMVADLRQLWDVGGAGEAVSSSPVSWVRKAVRSATGPMARIRMLVRMVGLGSLLGRVVPLLNVPLSSRQNAGATRRLGEEAMALYEVGDGRGRGGRRRR